MLEGLEIKEDNFSKVLGNKDFRIDSQFYTKEPIKNPLLKYDKIGNVLKKAQYGISIAMNEEGEGYPIYRMNEIHSMMCDLDVNKFADIAWSEANSFILKERDVLFNRTNSFEWVGRTGLYKKTGDKDFVFASYLVRFIPNEDLVLPEYLTTFLNSKQGIWDIKRRARQSINQTNVNPEEVKEIDIPLLSKKIQNSIKERFDLSHSLRVKAQKVYRQAEETLLEEIGMIGFVPNNDPLNIKTFAESFSISGRLDAEYYQKKYEDYLRLVRSYPKGSELLKEACLHKGANFNPDAKTEYSYIELSNIGKSGDINDCTVNLGEELPSRARRQVAEGDIIVSSIEGSLDSCALVTPEYNGALCSTGFYVLRSEKINPATLLVLFKSEPMQNILKQNCSGTILTAINKDEFLNIPLPLIEKTKQQEIAALIKQSFALKKESEQLLEVAKRAVEMAIEQDEAAALSYIQANT